MNNSNSRVILKVKTKKTHNGREGIIRNFYICNSIEKVLIALICINVLTLDLNS